jgi:hypothetical protein
VAGIERELAARGLAADLGRRYPASGRDNAAQLFSGRHAGHEHPVVDALGRLALGGGVDAAQLELGIPLRWPGPSRQALLDALEAALGTAADRAAGTADGRAACVDSPAAQVRPVAVARDEWEGRLEPVRVEEPASATSIDAVAAESAVQAAPRRGVALQAVLDDQGHAAAFCGFEATSPHAMAARFSVVCSDGSMMLLVGEAPWSGDDHGCRLEGMQWEWSADGSGRIRLDAPMVRYATHDAYLDLESGLASAMLVEARADLAYEPLGRGHGRLHGKLKAGALVLDIDATAFAEDPSVRTSTSDDRLRVALARPGGEVLRLASDDGTDLALDDGLGLVARGVRDDGFVGGDVLSRVPVWRPLGQGAFGCWTFGVARCRFADGRPALPGLFDRLQVFRLPVRKPQS